MIKPDIYILVQEMRPNMEKFYFENLYEPLIYHLETKIRKEVLHLDEKYDTIHLSLKSPHDDVYWTYVLMHLDLINGNMELYEEDRKMFEEAWKNLCRQVFLQKENFEIAELSDPEMEWS